MNHAITVAQLLFSLFALVGLVAAVVGLLMAMAGAMSDAGDDGTSGRGCGILICGLLLSIGCIVGLFL